MGLPCLHRSFLISYQWAPYAPESSPRFVVGLNETGLMGSLDRYSLFELLLLVAVSSLMT